MASSILAGRHSYGMDHVRLLGRLHDRKLHVGSFCSLASCEVFLGEGHHTDWVSSYPFAAFSAFPSVANLDMTTTKGDVVIENDVWVGSGAKINAGVRIGTGAVV